MQAETLRALERAAAKHTAARARVLAVFAGQATYETATAAPAQPDPRQAPDTSAVD